MFRKKGPSASQVNLPPKDLQKKPNTAQQHSTMHIVHTLTVNPWSFPLEDAKGRSPGKCWDRCYLFVCMCHPAFKLSIQFWNFLIQAIKHLNLVIHLLVAPPATLVKVPIHDPVQQVNKRHHRKACNNSIQWLKTWTCKQLISNIFLYAMYRKYEAEFTLSLSLQSEHPESCIQHWNSALGQKPPPKHRRVGNQ